MMFRHSTKHTKNIIPIITGNSLSLKLLSIYNQCNQLQWIIYFNWLEIPITVSCTTFTVKFHCAALEWKTRRGRVVCSSGLGSHMESFTVLSLPKTFLGSAGRTNPIFTCGTSAGDGSNFNLLRLSHHLAGKSSASSFFSFARLIIQFYMYFDARISLDTRPSRSATSDRPHQRYFNGFGLIILLKK